jgi:hypothetical protein
VFNCASCLGFTGRARRNLFHRSGTGQSMKNDVSSRSIIKKKIVTGPIAANIRLPTEDEWAAIQKHLGDGVSLSADLRAQLGIVSMVFAYASPAMRKGAPVKEIQKEIELWRHRSEHVREHLWANSKKTRTSKPTLAEVSERYRKLPEGIAAKPTLALLAEAIDAALFTSEYVIQKITRTDFPGTREHELWLIWVALVVHLLMENDILVTRITRRRQELKPEFIDFISELQKILPVEAQSRRTRGSLIKGLNEAELSFGRSSFDTLFQMLIFWGAMSLQEYVPDKHSAVSHKFSWGIALANLKSSRIRFRDREKARKPKRRKNHVTVPCNE